MRNQDLAAVHTVFWAVTPCSTAADRNIHNLTTWHHSQETVIFKWCYLFDFCYTCL